MRQIRWAHWQWVDRATAERGRWFFIAAIFRQCCDGHGDGSCYIYDHEGD